MASKKQSKAKNKAQAEKVNQQVKNTNSSDEKIKTESISSHTENEVSEEVAKSEKESVIDATEKKTSVPEKTIKPVNSKNAPERQYPSSGFSESHSGNNKKHRRKKNEDDRSLHLFSTKDAPFNYAEAYRSLRTNINFISSAEEVKSIVVTSAVPRESKSNVAVNLAVSLATEGKKVILVDCDLRKPLLHTYLKMGRNRQGLTDVLAGKAELDDCIAKFKDIKISILPAGTVPPNPSEMLSKPRMKNVIEVLEENFDYVILDTPPISVVTDAAIVGHYADGALLVVRSKFAPIETVKLAKKKLEDVNVKILGVILTRYNVKKSNKNTGYSYTYDYNYKYGGYGE